MFINFLEKFDEVKNSPESVDWNSIGFKRLDFFKALSCGIKKTRRKAVKWTDAELTALNKGVEVYGAGAWMQIKRHFSALEQRTAIGIKDKYRSLKAKQK